MPRPAGRLHSTLGIAVMVTVGVIPGAAAPPPDVQAPGVQLAAGTALVIGPSGFPIPSPAYVDTADALYLQPRGFTDTAQPLFTPEGFYPTTGVKSLEFDTSVTQGQQILDAAVQHAAAGGPVVVFGWSQSSTIASLTMPQLAAQGVPSGDVHFVLVGDPSNPNGGLLERFDIPINSASPTIPASASPSAAPPRATCIRPTSTPRSTTGSPTSRSTRSTWCRTSTPCSARFSSTTPTSA